MKHYLSFVLFFITTGLIGAQVETDRTEYRVDIIESGIYFSGVGGAPVRFKANTSAYGIQGSRWVFDEFVKSDVYFSNKSIAPDRLLNYDSYLDQIVFSDSSGKYVLNKFQVDYLVFNPGKDNQKVFKKLIEQEEQDIVFMEILYEGKSSLYKRHAKKLVIKDEQPTFNWDDKYANEYIIQDAFYLQLHGSKHPVRVPNNKKGLIRMLSPYQQSVKTYIKKNKINVKDDEELVMLISYYDTLLDPGVLALSE